MKKLLFLLLLLPTIVQAADNAIILDPGTTVPIRSKDIGGGVQSPMYILGDLTGTAIYGTAGTANANIITVQGIAGGTAIPVSSTTLGTAANQTTIITSLSTLNTSINSPITTCGANPCTNAIGVVDYRSQYPAGAVPITASATGTTAATTATLAGTSSKTTYICGYSIRANATAAATVTNTVTGVITATLSSIMWVAPLASGIGIDEQIFMPCIPASATNTGIAIVSGAPGTGGTVSSKGWGYQL